MKVKRTVDEINQDVQRLQESFSSDINRHHVEAKLLKVLVWGDYWQDGEHEKVLQKIIDALIDAGWTACLQKAIKKDAEIPDREVSKKLSQDWELVLLVDGHSIGTGVECGLICSDKTLQDKTIFLTKAGFDKICDPSEPYIYYPIYETYGTEEELIRKAVSLVRKESYRFVFNANGLNSREDK